MKPANWIFVLVVEQGAYGDTVNFVLRGTVYIHTINIKHNKHSQRIMPNNHKTLTSAWSGYGDLVSSTARPREFGILISQRVLLLHFVLKDPVYVLTVNIKCDKRSSRWTVAKQWQAGTETLFCQSTRQRQLAISIRRMYVNPFSSQIYWQTSEKNMNCYDLVNRRTESMIHRHTVQYWHNNMTGERMSREATVLWAICAALSDNTFFQTDATELITETDRAYLQKQMRQSLLTETDATELTSRNRCHRAYFQKQMPQSLLTEGFFFSSGPNW